MKQEVNIMNVITKYNIKQFTDQYFSCFDKDKNLITCLTFSLLFDTIYVVQR